MEASDIRATTAVESKHWWYRERRALIAKELRRLGRTGYAVEVGASGGGNSLVIREHGWKVLATEYVFDGAEIAASRGLTAIQADARHMPVSTGTADLVLSFDVLEHIQDDYLAAAEMCRMLRPGGTALIAVPCDMSLWSAHDVASGHVRRYTRETLTALVEKAGFRIERLASWNVLLRPVVAGRRKKSDENDVINVHPIANAALGLIIRAERYLPVSSLPGVSLILRARKPN